MFRILKFLGKSTEHTRPGQVDHCFWNNFTLICTYMLIFFPSRNVLVPTKRVQCAYCITEVGKDTLEIAFYL